MGPTADEPDPGGDERFRKSERLLKRPQFLHARRNGVRRQGRWVVVYAVANDAGRPRVGLTVSGRVGNAVVRNRWKRRLREIFRRNKHRFGACCDHVIIVKSGGNHPPFDRLKDDVLRTVERAVDSLDFTD